MKDQDNNKFSLDLTEIVQTDNVASLLDDPELDDIGAKAVSGYEIDSQSRQGWEDRIDAWVDMALQVKEPKTHPWPGAANVKYPLITTAALQFSARAYPALMPGQNLVRGRVVGHDYDGSKTERAIRIGRHMSYQILEQMEDWEEEMDRLLFALPIVGCMFKKTYYCPTKRRNVSQVVYPKDLIINYWARTLEDAERITHKLELSSNEVYERVASGMWLDVDLNKDRSLHERTTLDNRYNIEAPQADDDDVPYSILEQCTYIDLDGDGYKEPYIVTVDEATKQVVRIVPNFDPEKVELNMEGEIVRITPNHYYTKYSFIPSPDGSFYDIGFGTLLGPINETINTLVNQLLDSGTLNNMQSGFIARGVRIKGGNASFVPGEWKYANTPGGDLRNGIVPLPTKEPSQVLFSLLGMMVQSGEKLSSVTEIMTGEVPGQNTKATVAMNAVEQGMKVFTSIHKRTHRSLTKEYKKLFALNSKYLEPEEYFTILDPGAEEAAVIGVEDYNIEDVDVVPTSDPNVATEAQKFKKIQMLGQLLQIGTINRDEYTRRYLEAIDIPNIEPLMEVPPPQPNPEIEFEKQKFQDESERAWEELAIKRTTAESGAVKNYADAEAAEEGNQLDQYAQFMKIQQDDDLAGMKSGQAAQQFQMQMQQQQQQQQQQMDQQQQAQQMKMAQGQEQHGMKMAMQEQQFQQKMQMEQQKAQQAQEMSRNERGNKGTNQ